jgi:hypothetical protein
MRALPAFLVSVALVASACSDDAPISAPGTTAPGSGSTVTNPLGTDAGQSGSGTGSSGTGQFLRALTPFADCNAFLDHVKSVARDRVGPYGLDGGPRYFMEDDVMIADMANEGGRPDATSAPAESPVSAGDQDSSGASGSDGSFTGTNVQELGIDEPDIIKTDGDRILVVSENQLSYIDISGPEPVLTDQITLDEGWGHELFFLGDRALLFTNGGSWGWGGPIPIEPMLDMPTLDESGDADAQFAEEPIGDAVYPPEPYHGPAAVVYEIDLSDPNNLSVSGSMRIEGQYLSARAIDNHVRLAVSSGPNQLPWVYPQSQNGEQRATETNRAIIDESTLDDWIPSYELTGSDVSDGGPLLACGGMHHPAEFAGFDVISVLDLDLSSGLATSFDPNDAVGVLAGGQTIYSSNDRFYVATTKWAGADLATDEARLREWSDDYETDLHAFAIAPGEPTRYVASGTVRGSLLNQFSLDEYQGYLRVIGTDGSPWDDRNQSETRLVVLDEQADRLVAVGEVGGIGKGEQLFSARLMDDIGFAVTFRQTDPFYVLDLSEPTNPRISGELKIPGVSTYLHPIGDRMVLGIGQDATEQGVQTGLKLSLFDVSNPNDPREVSVWTMPNANSPAEWDHRAFQIFGSTAIVPVQDWNNQFNGVILFEIGDTITEIGRVSHLDDDAVVSTDCRLLSTDDVPQDTELWWMANEPSIRLQLCDANDRGGWGVGYCETIPVDEIRYWFGDEAQGDEVIATLGATPDDRFEICYPDDYYQEQIQRSLVADGVLWTMSRTDLQANEFTTLDPIVQFSIR